MNLDSLVGYLDRSAVREHLARSPYVLRCEDAEPNEGGDGVTIAVLAEL